MLQFVPANDLEDEEKSSIYWNEFFQFHSVQAFVLGIYCPLSVSVSGNLCYSLFQSLSPIIAKEQDEFMEYAKNNWDCSKFKIVEEEFINQMWKKKVKSVSLLPIYYTETGSIPFVSPKEIGVNYLTTCLELVC